MPFPLPLEAADFFETFHATTPATMIKISPVITPPTMRPVLLLLLSLDSEMDSSLVSLLWLIIFRLSFIQHKNTSFKDRPKPGRLPPPPTAMAAACVSVASSDCRAQPFPLPDGQGSIVMHEVTGKSLDLMLRELARLSAPRDRNNNFGPPRFPGPFPVSLERASLEGLLRPAAAAAEVEMWVAEKTDGVRVCLLACTLGGVKMCALFTRKLSCHLLPLKKFSNVGFQGTVLDGELARNRVTGRVELLVFDAVVAGGCAVHQRFFSGRIQAAQQILGSCEMRADDPVDVRMKNFLPFNRAMISNLRPLLAEASAKYGVDGIVFVPERQKVVYGRNESLLKHKVRIQRVCAGCGFGFHAHEIGWWHCARRCITPSILPCWTTASWRCTTATRGPCAR